MSERQRKRKNEKGGTGSVDFPPPFSPSPLFSTYNRFRFVKPAKRLAGSVDKSFWSRYLNRYMGTRGKKKDERRKRRGRKGVVRQVTA